MERRIRRNPRRVVLLTLLVAFSISPALAVKGLVVNEDGQPLVGVRVCHYQTQTSVEQYCGVTDAEGKFELRATTRSRCDPPRR